MPTFQIVAIAISGLIFLRLVYVFFRYNQKMSDKQASDTAAFIIGVLLYPALYVICGGIAKLMEVLWTK